MCTIHKIIKEIIIDILKNVLLLIIILKTNNEIIF